MSLVKSRELFLEASYPIAVDTVVDRTLIQRELHRHEYFEMLFVERGSLIKQWNLADLEADLTWCGRNGSPTKVHRIQSVVLAGKDSKVIETTEAGISAMIHELIEDNIIA